MKVAASLAIAASLLGAVQAIPAAAEKTKTVTVTKEIIHEEIKTKTVTKKTTVVGSCSATSSAPSSTYTTTTSSPVTSPASYTTYTTYTTDTSDSTSNATSTITTATTTSSSISSTSYPATTYPTTPAYPFCTSTAAFAAPDSVHPRLFNYNGTGASYFAGTNAWWASHILSDSDLTLVFDDIKNTQLQVVRVWGFGSVNTDPGPDSVFFQLLNSTGSYINYAANGIPRLDAVVSQAEAIGLKVVLNFVNNWSDLGGIASYNAAFGGNASSWYTDTESQDVYKSYISLLVNRYKCSPAIFAWELANEPRCTLNDSNGCDTSVIYNWATDISEYVKSIDDKHMVTLGDEGWFAPPDNIGDGSYAYQGGSGVDFVLNLGIDTLDYGTFHLYPDSWGYNETWGSTWIEEHNAVGASLNKPVVLEEYGGPPSPDNHTAVELPWQATVLYNTSLAMDQFWQFGTNDTSTGLTDYDDYTIWYNGTEYQLLARDHAAAMLEKAV